MRVPFALLEALRDGAGSGAVLAELMHRHQLDELLDDVTSLEAFLEAGLDPNAVAGGMPLLAHVLLQNGAHTREAMAALVAHGASWSSLVPVVMGRWPNEHAVMVPIAHMLLYVPNGSAYWPCVSIWEHELDPGLVDPEWGGNLAHHAATRQFGLGACYVLGQAGVDLDQVAYGRDEAAVAWAKMVGDWVPEFVGKTPRQICEAREPGGLEAEARRAKAEAEARRPKSRARKGT